MSGFRSSKLDCLKCLNTSLINLSGGKNVCIKVQIPKLTPSLFLPVRALFEDDKTLLKDPHQLHGGFGGLAEERHLGDQIQAVAEDKNSDMI